MRCSPGSKRSAASSPHSPRDAMSLFDPGVERHLIADEGEVIVDEVRKHWAAVVGPILEILAIIPVLRSSCFLPSRAYWVPLFLAVVPRAARAVADAPASDGPFRDHEHAGVPRARHPLAERRHHADLANPRHLGAQADRRPHLRLRALRVRVGGAGAGTARDQVRRLARRARHHDPARHPALRPPRARPDRPPRSTPTVRPDQADTARDALVADDAAEPRRPSRLPCAWSNEARWRPRTARLNGPRGPRHPRPGADFSTRHSAGILDRPPVVCRTRSGAMASYPSGQRDLTVNQLSTTSGVRIPHSPREKAPVSRGFRRLSRLEDGFLPRPPMLS